ncbi:MAG TPA: alpha-glucoside-specific PTS transporter subunit IIBC [Atopostipes sp.]|jgi:PTS system arbutin-like IIC component|nr:alpha-glucoside-specific PTS transporter subunit IIBC [Atopostipes sp.]
MQKIQRFGGAMIIPVMLFAFFGIIVGVTTFFQQEMIFGALANPDGFFWKIMDVIQQGGWTVFNQINLLFVIGLPISLANKQQARASMESFVVYMVFNYFLSAMLGHWGNNFGVDFSLDAGGESGLAMVAGVKTLDIGMIGAIIVTLITIYLHNKFFDTKVPDWLTAFRGSPTVVAIGFFTMLPVAAVFMMVWPQVQNGISSLQVFIINSGTFGVWLYTFLERILIPTGMHHILNTPFQFDNIVINGGLLAGWVEQLPEIARSGESLRTLFPEGGYALYGLSKVFAPIGISYAFYKTAHEDKKAEVAGLMIPVTLTAIIAGVTEPIEFTFLFIAPVLFLVHSILAATFITVVYIAGISGYFTGGLIEFTSYNFLPLGASHWQQYLLLLGIGLVFSAIWYIVFRVLIVRMDLKTPGRENDEEEMHLYSKEEYQESRQTGKFDEDASNDPKESRKPTGDLTKPEGYLQALGGKDNVENVTNCVTRLRVTVKDPELVAPEGIFKKHGAIGLVHNGTNVQVIDGTDVTFTREEFEELL